MSHLNTFRQILIPALACIAVGCGGGLAPNSSSLAANPGSAQIQPSTVTLSEGQTQAFTATFSSKAPGSPAWSATGGTITAGASSGSQATATFTAGSAPGAYTVTVADASGEAPLASATITVTAPAAPLTAQIQPSAVSLAEGQAQTFTANFSGSAPGSPAWSATGGTITASAGSGSQATATFTAGSNPGSYTVAIAAASGDAPLASATVTITAPAPPALTAQIQPATATLTEGQAQTFTATFNTDPPASLAWAATGGSIAAGSSNGTQATAAFTAGSTPGTYTVTVATASGDTPLATATVTVTAPSTTTTASTPRIFLSSSANWLYSAPTGTGLNISSMVSGLTFSVNTHDGGFDYPVQYTNGGNGCTTFTDTLVYDYTDSDCVPIPTGGFAPSTGGYGADDGHLVVVNSTTGDYYDFWKLTADSSGNPTSTNVGAIFHGNVNTSNGTPGTTAANITGLAGDIMPGELDCETCLQHALNVVVPGSMNSNQVGTQAPATKTDGTVSGAIFREGAKIGVDPSLDVDSLDVSTAVKALLTALQLYGGVITDQTSADGISFYSDLPTQPDLTGIDEIGQYLYIYY